MATTNAIFQFDQGTVFFGTTGSFTEHGVTFTLSSVDSTGGSTIRYLPSNVSQTGVFNVSEISGPPDVTMTLAINNSGGFSKFTGTFTITADPIVNGTWQVQHGMAIVGTFNAAQSKVIVTAGQSGGSAIKFIHTGGGFASLTIDSINATINCFLAGTRIATPGGAVAVEDLRPGMRIRTADGRETAVKWVGTQAVDVRLRHPAKVNPVRITAGALGGGLPERDLLISPDHAVAIDGLLINAGALVNGSTIRQEPKMPMDGFTYYHVETDAHELLLAEGVAAETFIDYAGRDSFENGGESTAHIPEMDLPRISSARLVPQHIRAALTPAIAAE